MTNEQKKIIAAIFTVRAELTGKTFSQNAIRVMIEDLEGLEFDEILFILRDWGKKETSFPYPALIHEKLNPETSSREDGLHVANLIINCVSSCGYTNPEIARFKMGGLAWEVVRLMGGWKHICETTTLENENTLRAQIRDYAETISKKAKNGSLLELPELPEKNEVLKITSGIFK